MFRLKRTWAVKTVFESEPQGRRKVRRPRCRERFARDAANEVEAKGKN
jgi:hypothetical protein